MVKGERRRSLGEDQADKTKAKQSKANRSEAKKCFNSLLLVQLHNRFIHTHTDTLTHTPRHSSTGRRHTDGSVCMRAELASAAGTGKTKMQRKAILSKKSAK